MLAADGGAFARGLSEGSLSATTGEEVDTSEVVEVGKGVEVGKTGAAFGATTGCTSLTCSGSETSASCSIFKPFIFCSNSASVLSTSFQGSCSSGKSEDPGASVRKSHISKTGKAASQAR